ncbi:SRPBCC family protein [Micromonospora sp. NPDC051296]|uniref:SRPBCC family protein n=1 Tax=Micromonospora sp. NPDC051296 TaxID=3155046 RepID=UPI00341FDAFC
MNKIFDILQDTDRELRDHPSGMSVLVLRRSYDASPEELWDAITDPQRLVRWFLPITGDLRAGGRFQLEGNAGGEIRQCERPSLIGLSWESGGSSSEVHLRLTPAGEATVLELEHAPVPAEIVPNAAPGVWGLGAGWEMGLVALADYLAGDLPEGRAVDWIAAAGPEQMAAASATADQISDAWVKVIGGRS